MSEFTTAWAAVGEVELYLVQGGHGRPCLVLHGIEGHEGWLAFHAALAERASVLAPAHPGYGQTAAPDWITSVLHQALFYSWYLQAADLREVDLVGVGLGGWIAAYLAMCAPERLAHLVLINAVGVRPAEGEIFDIFVARWRDVIDRGFADPAAAPEYQRIYGSAPIQDFGGPREAGRTMTMRTCFRPYMYDPSLPGLLPKITTPTLVVHGLDDAIVPRACADRYQQLIPGAALQTLARCGHFAHLERPRELADLIGEFSAS